jgi:2-polyprenyl-6-methoxyphenol hydroxylase-like FAD-dependent oxidoreductase
MHPLAGQGLNLGFGDVATLLDVVAGREPFRDLGDRLLLRRYERARREPVLAMTWTTDALQRLFDPDPGASLPPLLQPLRTLREAGWRAVAASPWLRQRLVRHAMS